MMSDAYIAVMQFNIGDGTNFRTKKESKNEKCCVQEQARASKYYP
jgi:hypothetical protein